MDDQTESFDFDQADYEYATGERKFKKQTKEDRIYGIWAEEEEDDDRSSFSFGGKKQKDTAPMRFVSGGVTIGSKRQFPDGTVEEEEEEVTIIEARPEKKTKPTLWQQPAAQKEAGSQVFAGMRSFANAGFQSTSGGAADSAWTNTGKGNVIMQMMQKMGYEQGKGLGKSKQGIVEPVQAVQRPGRGAVGAYGSEAKGPKFGETAADAQARIRSTNGAAVSGDIISETISARGTWKKGNAARAKVQYKTLDEVISEGESQRYTGLAPSSSVGKIIDMTGPEHRVYEDFTSFSRRARMPTAGDAERTHFNIPELTHNLNTLLDVTEEEIFKTDKHIHFLKDQNEVLSEEEKRIKEELKESDDEIRRLEGVGRLIQRFYQMQSEVLEEDSLQYSLDECRDLFGELRTKYAAEYTMYGLDTIAIPVLLPKIKAFFTNWDPLDPEHTDYGFAMMNEWKDILGRSKGGSLFRHFDKDSNSSISAFDHCVWSGWMPNVRRAALAWNPRTNGPVMISLVQMWSPILPNWVIENFFEQVLVPRIKEQVDEWDPVTDPIPIESWLQPWHRVMGDRLLLIYAAFRQRLAKGLRNWFPTDKSAIEIIRPWKDIFTSNVMNAFIGMNIVPKLEKALQTIDISTTEHFGYLGIFDWLDFVNVDVIGQLLIKHFFPRYMQLLCYQLNAPGITVAEFDRIKNSYQEWKNLFPSEIQQHGLVMAELKRVLLQIVNAHNRLAGPAPGIHRLPVPGSASGHPHRIPLHQAMPPGPFGLPPPPAQFTAQLPPSNFKQLVEDSAISNGLQFFPQRSKFHDGKQVYMYGDFSIYIDGTILFYYSPPMREWLPASLNQMLDMCRNK